MEIPIDPHVELFKWGPAPLRYFYQSDFNLMMGGGAFEKKYPEYLWPPSLAFYIDRTILWVNEFDALRERGCAAFIDVFLNRRELSIRRDYQQMSDELARLERRIDDVAVVKIDDADLMKLWRELHRAIIGFITPGLIPELCNYGADRLLEDKLKGYLGASVDSIPTLMEVLTAPEEISFYQEEEMRLAETDDIAEHQRQYYWIGNSYSQVEALPQSFFIERKKNLLPGLREKSRLRIVEVQRNKDDVRGKYSLPEEIMSIGKAIESSVLWQDNRKENILRYLHYKNMLLDEVIRRKGWRKDDLLNFSFEEIAETFTGIDYTEQIEERKKGFAEYITNTRTLLNADESRKYFELYSNQEASGDEREISGIVASKGFATGRVRILLDPHQSDRLLPGEVLVAPMTSPEYIFAMRRAVAIVTDSGGLTSHAAIVSRELEVPCIVGTGVVTQVLHDGDLVEVDADRGVVRVIERVGGVVEEGQGRSDTMLSVDNVDAQTKYERVYTRENCLLAFQVWEEHQTKTIAELLNWADRPILFDAHEGVAHVYYHELTFIDYEANIIKKTLRDSGFITKTMHWYGEILDYLEPVWKVGRPLQSREKLLEFYERALDAWCGLDISYVVPLMDQASVDDKRLAMSMRERASDFLEEIDHVFQRTLGVLYPELGDLVKYIRIEEVRGDDMFPTITALKNRKRHFLYYDREIYTDRTLIQFLKSAHIEITEDCVSPGSDTGTLKGQAATRGKIQGRARILHRKADILLIQAGEILITAMTTPDYVPAMQRAAAFVTDEGGITCHAAIIAREMKKPCIIGTKIATQVLHDGDLVEVDADHGVVRVIQRASL